jgi:5-methylcytosine-specific restriction endonuclease McrA
MSPFCEWCGAVDDLTVDHIIPSSEAPGLVYEICNLRVLCRDCNTRRGTNVTDDERNLVYVAIRARKERRAQRVVVNDALTTRGDAPSTARPTPEGKAEFRLLTADRGSE